MNGAKRNPHNGYQWDKPANTISPHWEWVASVAGGGEEGNAGGEYWLWKEITNFAVIDK